MRALKTSVFLAILLLASLPAVWAAGSPPKKIDLPDEAVFKKVFENGLVLLVKERPAAGLVAIDVALKAGSATEGALSGSGISHLIEHMVFKGTSSRRAGEIDRTIKSYGGLLNAKSSQDITHYHVIVPAERLEATLGLLKDMLTNASFEKAELEKEREVILKEIKLEMDEPQSRLMRLLNETAYIEHPYRFPVIGYEDIFRSLKKEDLTGYYAKMYVPNRMVIAVVGDLDTARVVAAAGKELDGLRDADYAPPDPVPQERTQAGKRARSEAMEINLAYIACGFHSTGILDKDLFALNVLAMILGRGDNSRLNVALQKERRLVHSISAWNYTPRDPGLFVITASLDERNAGIAERGVMEEIGKVRSLGVKADELEAAKRMVLADFIFSLETAENDARNLAEDEALTGSYSFSRRYAEGVQSVSAEDVKRVAGAYLVPDNLTVVRVLPSASSSAQQESPAKPAGQNESVKMEVLPNGLRIVVREDRRAPVVSVTAAIGGGLLAEDRKDNGISAVAARMLLKGTPNRKEADIKGAIEELGGNIEPFSGLNSFGMNMEILKPDINEALGILKDILTGSNFPDDALYREKTLTLAMIAEEDDDIFGRGLYLLKKELFEDHPYAMRELGEPCTVRTFSREVVSDFYRGCAVPDNMVISVSGDVNAGETCGRLKDLFKDMARRDVTPTARSHPSVSSARTKSTEMYREESLVMIGFLTVGMKDADRFPLEVLGSVLSGQSGRLFRDLRDIQALAYTLGCVHMAGPDTGCMVLYAATTRENIERTRKELLKEIKMVRDAPPGEDELRQAKSELINRRSIMMQSNSFFTFESAVAELCGLGYGSLYRYKDDIAAVTKEDLRRVAGKYLDPDKRAEILILSK